ncbi:hypothetical protein [Cyanobacterium aponinum]|uniref:Uncharacterized protein n=1 Tax=Cyanobacterium aponinum (strain PCC 10605) TaxID=755178 RepID=K9Z7K5_CYAAP|nr:hypothetical protein [Cyanobacterium aponinum]AFZ54565.1 hypothetical protein Cyan10605_2484 [Cyanobacterium aponinum PCC 10605]
MNIITNRLKFTFHIDNIKRDFIFLSLQREKNSKWWGAKQLDYIIGDEYKALAVCYKDNYAYAMFKKQGNNGYELEKRIRNNDDCLQDCIAKEVEIEKINSCDEENFINNEVLGRLLLNYLGSSRSRFSNLHFSNLTGSLLKIPSLKIGKLARSILVAQVNLNYIKNTDNEFLLNVSMGNYRLEKDIRAELKNAKGKDKKQLLKYLKRPRYVIDEGKATLIRWLGSEDKNNPNSTYIKAGKKGKKAHKNFLNFDSLADFENSKAGILHQVILDMRKYLKSYLTVEFIPLETKKCLRFDRTNFIFTQQNKATKKLNSIIENQSINIIDLVNNEESQNLVEKIKKELIPYFQNETLISVSNHDINDAFNVRIIRDKNYYKRNNIEDKYLSSENNIQRQNLTIESIPTKEIKTIIKTIIKELIIKQDISRQKISLFDWSKITQLSNKKWIFAMYDENNDDKNQNKSLTFMTINHDGSFELDTLTSDDNMFLQTHKYDEYKEYIEQVIKQEKKAESYFKFEGFILSENHDINLIFRSDEITLPNLDQIKFVLEEQEKELSEYLSNGFTITNIVQDFLTIYPQFNNNEKFDIFCQELKNNYPRHISKKELYGLIKQYLGGKNNSASTKEATQFRDYLLEKYQVRFTFPKDNDSKYSFFFNNININYFGETETEAHYFVGCSVEAINSSFKDSCHLRKIVAVKNSQLVFQDLLKTMDVDFVRTGQSTVIPFPFKYIREYHNLSS